jgi:hypothetical protein
VQLLIRDREALIENEKVRKIKESEQSRFSLFRGSTASTSDTRIFEKAERRKELNK